MDASNPILAAVGALAGVVVYLYRKSEVVAERHAKQIKETTDKQAAQGEEIGELRGRQDGIERLSAEVLQIVHTAATTAPKDLTDALPDLSDRTDPKSG